MTTTKAQTTFQKYGGFYYTDQLTFTTGQGILTCSKLVFTANAALIDTRIDEVTAKHLRPEIVLIRGKL